jgi:long-chain acyl-CoA synthetase
MAVLTKGLAETRPDDLALADEHSTRTWAELDQRVNQLISAARSAGIDAGDTIALIAGNCVEWFETVCFCANAGITFVPVNWHLVGPEIAYILADSGAKAVVVGHQFEASVAAALADDIVSSVELALLTSPPADTAPRDANSASGSPFTSYEDFVSSGSPLEPEDQSFGGPMFYTSGTTGHPKGVRGSLSAMPPGTDPAVWTLVGASIAQFFPPAGRTALCGPAYHSAQWAFSFLPMTAGSSIVMQHKYDSAELLALIDTHAITNVHLVPTQMKRLTDLPAEVRESFDGSSLEVVLHGAAPCPPGVKQEMIDWWGPKISEYYGSTEGSVITMVSSEQWMAKGGSVGPPLPGFEIIVVNDAGERVGPNTSGTLYFRNGSGRDFSYHNAPDKTEAAHLEPGVFTTGDVGYLDDDGYLWLSDRKIDMIISGGVNIYPAEIEGVLGDHPLIADVAVIGVPNEDFGEEVKAVVVLNDRGRSDVDARAIGELLSAHCRENLAGYKVPRTFDIVDELPRTGTGKVQKRRVREPYWVGRERKI